MILTLRTLFLIIILLSTTATFAQIEASSSANVAFTNDDRPLLYLDCQACDYDFIREEIRFVNYVRDQDQADIHLFITAEGTGGGGREYELSFYGRREFSGMEYTYTHQVDRNLTDDEIRESLNDAIRIGLSPFMMKTPYSNRFRIDYDDTDLDHTTTREVDDPWNYWVFEIYAGSLQMDIETNRVDFDSRWGFFADRVTEEWKLRIRPYFNYDFTEIEREEDDPLIRRRHRHGLNTYAIRSITDHWSAALFSDYLTRNDRNLKHRYRVNPGVEYSIFPYREATRRAITIDYRIGYTHFDYYEQTIFEETQEDLFNHQLSAQARYQQPWGSINAGISGSHYFHDFDLRSLQMYGRSSIRLSEGLSLSLQFDYDIIQDQLTLPAGEGDIEDILLDQRELATDFNARWLIALSYTFGSDFANVVNTRF